MQNIWACGEKSFCGKHFNMGVLTGTALSSERFFLTIERESRVDHLTHIYCHCQRNPEPSKIRVTICRRKFVQGPTSEMGTKTRTKTKTKTRVRQ